MHARPVFVVADVGGTHARLGLASYEQAFGHILESSIQRYSCKDWPSLEAIVQDYLQRTQGAHTASGVLVATAGYVLDDDVVNRNLPWAVSLQSVQRVCAPVPVRVVNDFEALAYATLSLASNELRPILVPATRSPHPCGSAVVLGPGTGLGSAILVHGSAGPQVLGAEAGHIALAPSAGRELEVFRHFASQQAYVPTEQVLSGPGLLAVYRALASIDGRVLSGEVSPADISAMANADTDPHAVEAMDIFCGLLGSLAADMAMLVNATGGIYIGGGFVPALLEFLPRSSFEARFFNKGIMRRFLQQIPVWALPPAEYGMRGGAVMAGLQLAQG